MKLKSLSLPFLGFLQATGLVIYVGLISQISIYGNQIFSPVGNFVGPIVFLLLFVLSALISGLIILARAAYLFWERKYKESFTLIGWTLSWLLLYLALAMFLLYIFR